MREYSERHGFACLRAFSWLLERFERERDERETRLQRGQDVPEYGLPHIGHIELGIDASRPVCVLLAVECSHVTVAVLAETSHVVRVPAAHRADGRLAQVLAS